MSEAVATQQQGQAGKYRPYPEYKDSGVEWLGIIPTHWSLHALKRTVSDCSNGIWGDEPNGESDLIVLRVADFDRNKLTISDDKLTYRSISERERKTRLLKKGDLLIEKSGGGEKTLVGCVVLFDKEYSAVTSNFVAKMSPREAFCSNFLSYAFSHLYAGRVNYPSIKQTTGIQNLDSESYLMEHFCFPDSSEQQTIAAFLDYETARIDRLIAKQQQLIELLKEKRQEGISHAVTKGLNPNAPMKDSGVEWLGQVPEHWCVFRLKHLAAQMKAGPFGSSLTKDMYVSSGYKIYGQEQVIPGDFSIGDYYISEDKYAELRQYAVKAGDILISCVGTFGKIAVFPKDAQEGVINPRLIKVSPTEVILPEFLELVLRSQVAFEQMTLFSRGGTMDVVNIGILSEIRVTVPPILEQKSLLSEVNIRVEQYDHLVNKAENTISLLKERRTALISAAVTGKIDLRGWTPPADEVAA